MRRFRSLVLVVSLFVAWPAAAQSFQIPAKGTEATLDVATWNVEWFGDPSAGPDDDAQQLANVREVIQQADIDLWAVQEIADEDDFDQLLSDLGDDWSGVLAHESGTLRIGFIYKTSVVRILRVRHILEQFDGAFAGRPPLQLDADVTFADTTATLSFIALHMKCCSDEESYERRVEAANRLKNHIDFLSSSDPIIILGDFNDELLSSIHSGEPSPYQNFLDDPDDYFFPTLALDQQGINTFCFNGSCSSGSTLDHILITDELVDGYESDSASRYEELLGINRYVSTTSDHLPVFARFRFRTSTSVHPPAVPVPPVTVHDVYPNPFRQATTMAYTLSQPRYVRVEVFDLLGRRVDLLVDERQALGAHRVTFVADQVPLGLYFLRVNTEGASITRRVLHLR